MMGHLFALSAGLIFAIGLSISGMINPNKVIGFLDVFGRWDYSLAFVMAGAVVFNFFAFKYLKNKKPICSNEHFLPTKTEIDKNLVLGSILFGTGWGLAGICPGPGIVNLVTLNPQIMLFLLAMIIGMLLFKMTAKYWE